MPGTDPSYVAPFEPSLTDCREMIQPGLQLLNDRSGTKVRRLRSADSQGTNADKRELSKKWRPGFAPAATVA